MAETSKLKTFLTRAALRRLAGPRSFERGVEYFLDGHVTSLLEHDRKLTATVQGTEDYQVEISIRGHALDYNCTCPFGADGEFCKHCVSAGLAWLANGPGKSPSAKRGVTETPVVTLDDARAWLCKQEKPKLVEMLLHQALNDTHLREQLLLQTAKTVDHRTTVATIRNAMDRATRTGGFVDYRAAYDFSQGINEAVDSIAGLLKEGYAAEVIGLTEYALDKVEQATLNMDDSNGYMGGILQRLQQWHLEACRKAKPDSVSLAGRLFEWELRTQFDTFHGAANVYARVLGKHGLAAYRQRAEAVWASVPEIKPGQKDPAAFGKNYRIKNIMEALARLSGDVELLVAVKARDLSLAYAFLQIAEIYREAGRPDQALDWAEKGIKAFPQRTDPRLLEFLADEYHRRRRHNEAMELIWKIFAEGESLEHYRTLKQHADRVRQWPAWRAKALEFIRAEIVLEKKEQTQKCQAWGWIPAPVDHSLLVQIFLWEKDVEAAWREAQSGGCHDGLWMELARLRKGRFPGDVVPVYQRQVELLVNQKSSASYREAAQLLGKVRDLMTKLGQADRFRGYLAAVRATHKPKRNFIKLAARL